MSVEIADKVMGYLDLDQYSQKNNVIRYTVARCFEVNVGQSQVFDRDTGQYKQIVITQCMHSYTTAKESYAAWTEDDEHVGCLTVSLPHNETNGLKLDFLLGQSPLGKYRGAGTVLTQAAIELSGIYGYGFKVHLFALPGGSTFWYDFLFRYMNLPKNEEMRKELELAEREDRAPNTENLGGYMALSPVGIEIWKRKISKEPVLDRQLIKMKAHQCDKMLEFRQKL